MSMKIMVYKEVFGALERKTFNQTKYDLGSNFEKERRIIVSHIVFRTLMSYPLSLFCQCVIQVDQNYRPLFQSHLRSLIRCTAEIHVCMSIGWSLRFVEVYDICVIDMIAHITLAWIEKKKFI